MGIVVKEVKSERVSLRLTPSIKRKIETEILPRVSKETGTKCTLTDYIQLLIEEDLEFRTNNKGEVI